MTRQWRRFIALAPAHRRLLAGTAALFICARLLLWATPMPRARRWLVWLAGATGTQARDAHQLAWGIEAAARALPARHSCLIQALVCEAIALTSGIPVEFRIGAARQGEKMRFHAWIEHDGAIIAGAHDGEFVALG